MTKFEAHRLLDRARNGEDVTELGILDALRATGDLGPLHLCSRHEQGGAELPVPTCGSTSRSFAMEPA